MRVPRAACTSLCMSTDRSKISGPRTDCADSLIYKCFFLFPTCIIYTSQNETHESGQGAGGRGGGGGGGRGGGPLDQLAEMIGVGGRFVKIPGALGVQENEVPLIYLMIAALVVRKKGRSSL